MKIRKLHIDEYKMFKDFDIDFVDENDETLPIVVLAGVNGSGKTTLLKSIFDSNELNKDYHPYLSKFDKHNERKDINIQLIIDKDKYNIVQFNKPIDIEINNNSFSEEEKEFYLNHIFSTYVEDGCKNYNNNRDNFFGNLVALENIIGKFIDELIYEGDIVASEVYDQVVAFIKESLYDLDMDIEFKRFSKNREVIMSNSEGEEFLLKDLSSGEKTLFSKIIFLYFSKIKDSTLLIDEPELSLHPSWQNKILKIYENFALKNNCQIIIATHSPHIIGSAKNEYLRILRKNDEGRIEVIDNSVAYGRDIEWVLEEVMGVQYTREKNILLKIEACEDLIENEEYDKAEEAINNLENIIGENDSEILTLRNSLAFERIDFEEDN